MATLSGVELCFWNLEKAASTVAHAKSALSANGLNPDRAEPVPDATAFRRAVNKMASGKETLVRFWTRKKDSALCAQIDHEAENGDGKLSRKFKARCVMTVAEDGAINFDVDGDASDNELRTAQYDATQTYIGGDISKIIQEIVTKDGLGAYSPRKNGGVYFVPVKPDAQDLLDKIEAFSKAVGVRFLRYEIPDTGEQRAEVAQAVADSLNADLDAHGQAIAEYAETTKLAVLDKRAEAINYTRDMVQKLWTLIPVQAGDLNSRIEDLRAKLADARSAAEAAKEKAAPARRIAGVNTGAKAVMA